MKIYDSQLSGPAAAGTQSSQETQHTGRTNLGARVGGDGPADRVEFSGTLGRLSRAISASRADRDARVQALSALYQNGQYRVDAAAVSRGIVADALGSAPRRV